MLKVVAALMIAQPGAAPGTPESPHLSNLKHGQGFWTYNVDSIFFSVLLGLVFVLSFWLAARKVRGRHGHVHQARERLHHVPDRERGEVAQRASRPQRGGACSGARIVPQPPRERTYALGDEVAAGPAG